MKNAEVWEKIRLNFHALTMSIKRVRMVIKGTFEDLYFESCTMESKKIRHFPAKSIVTTVTMWSSKSREVKKWPKVRRLLKFPHLPTLCSNNPN